MQKNITKKNLFLIIAIAVGVAVICGAVFSASYDKNLKEWSNLLASVEIKINEHPEASTLEKTELDTILSELDSLKIASNPYIKGKAYFLSATLYDEADESEKALADYENCIRVSNNYLKDIAIINKGYLEENLSDNLAAFASFKLLADNEKSLYWQEASFNVARLAEKNAQNDVAITYYKNLTEKLEGSNFWAVLAVNRLLEIS